MTGTPPDRRPGLRLVARVLSTTGAILVVGGIYLVAGLRQFLAGGVVFAAGLIDLLMAFLFWQRAG
ncbi:MAG: hypothetical protein ACREL5_09905 [Gemmatimonadales bacterium]